MLILNTIAWAIIHSLIALAINMLAIWLGIINYGELFALYFVVVAARLYLAQIKFSTAYREDPELVEQILRSQFLNEDNNV